MSAGPAVTPCTVSKNRTSRPPTSENSLSKVATPVVASKTRTESGALPKRIRTLEFNP